MILLFKWAGNSSFKKLNSVGSEEKWFSWEENEPQKTWNLTHYIQSLQFVDTRTRVLTPRTPLSLTPSMSAHKFMHSSALASIYLFYECSARDDVNARLLQFLP